MYSEDDDRIAGEIYDRGIAGFEPESVRTFLSLLARSASVIFDIGANTGVYALSAARVSPHASVLAFEPVSKISSLVVRKSIAPRLPTWAAQASEDLIFLLELAERGRCVLVAEPLVGYRRHHNSHRGRTSDLELKRFRFIIQWLDRRPDIPDGERKAITARALSWLVKEARKVRKQRDFDAFDRIVEEINAYRAFADVRELLDEGRYPAIIYSAYDLAKKARRFYYR